MPSGHQILSGDSVILKFGLYDVEVEVVKDEYEEFYTGSIISIIESESGEDSQGIDEHLCLTLGAK
jgi:hypothetical protein